MYALLGSVALFLLLAAGIIAFQNSRIIREQENDSSRAYTGYLMYSVYNQDFSPDKELPEAVPLFQFTLFDGYAQAPSEGEAGTTYALCRVAAGKGEMVLSDAQTYMLGQLRQAVLQGIRLEYAAYAGKAARRGEKELIKVLEQAVLEEARHADQS
ncbi:hypothetical protein [Paenibacillus sp. MMS20-IR301]|uniref:hypothetical protein n=1 Tax=Paenibacillus sp. MMS20-IR301 TaxID=2895946 RepID=UPI0028E5F29A|nr:hypothetical protein [Paenibacillus sp. MMS20-IR301]WNS45696.1 hypothetical protein LOS79_10625 [Paenibacillus sp. MMS20-IR301]